MKFQFGGGGILCKVGNEFTEEDLPSLGRGLFCVMLEINLGKKVRLANLGGGAFCSPTQNIPILWNIDNIFPH